MIETKERKIAVETSERANERARRARVSFRFVSFRFVFSRARETSRRGEKNVSISRLPSALPPPPSLPLGNPKGTGEEKKGKIVCHVLPGAGSKRGTPPRPTEDGNPQKKERKKERAGVPESAKPTCTIRRERR